MPDSKKLLFNTYLFIFKVAHFKIWGHKFMCFSQQFQPIFLCKRVSFTIL